MIEMKYQSVVEYLLARVENQCSPIFILYTLRFISSSLSGVQRLI